MTTGYNQPKAGASATFLSSAVRQSQVDLSKGAAKHHALLVAAGANRGGTRRKKRKRGGTRRKKRKRGG